MIRPLLFCLLVGSSVSAFAQDSAPSESTVLTLEQAVSIAHANNRSVKNAQLVASIDEDQIAEARTYRFPSLNLYALGSQLLTPVDFIFKRGAFGSFPDQQGQREVAEAGLGLSNPRCDAEIDSAAGGWNPVLHSAQIMCGPWTRERVKGYG